MADFIIRPSKGQVYVLEAMMASHLETLIHEYLEWRGYFVRRNIRVGRLSHGGWEMELDLIGFHPSTEDLVHYEPSLDALSWDRREQRFKKKFTAARKYLFTEVFTWLRNDTNLRQFAVLPTHPVGRDYIAGATLISIDELMCEIRTKVQGQGVMSSAAISEGFPLLRTLQLSHVGYNRVILSSSNVTIVS